MGKDLIISSNRHETKVAVLEDEQLVEVFFQRSNEYSLVGSIHKGRVTRVLPGMQSAFVDIGLERDAFLYVSDFFEESDEYERVSGGEKNLARKERPQAGAGGPPAGAAGGEREEETDARDRRGRRSRRRRNRGRSFPEAKYAPDLGARVSPPPVEPAPPSEQGDAFPLLPGESLAKYQRGEAEPVDTALVAGEAPPQLLALADEEDESEPHIEISPPESEERDIQDIVLEQLESMADEPQGAAAESPAGEEETEAEEAETDVSERVEEGADEAVEIAAEPAAGEELTARLREPEARYTHRVSRRMRRRPRGVPPGKRGDERRTPREEAPAVRAEPATVERPEEAPLPSIADLLKEGQEILVQIAKEPLGQKGARITSHIALPGRYVVYMPTLDHLGVSRKISSEEERLRLKRILLGHRTGVPGGFIMRTAGEGKSEQDIAADMTFLFDLWVDIRRKAEKKPAPALLHHDLQIVKRILRDQVTDDFKCIWADNEETYEDVLNFLHRFQPSLVSRVKMYTRPTPIFDAFNVTAELEKALRPKVWLKSGGYIVINQTEALVAIDINTGKYVGKSNRLEDTIVKTNTEAIKEIVRQMRLRDLGGIIVVDFIDMDERKNRQKVMQTLEEAMRSDRAPYKILQFNDFGLVAITRKRVKQSLERTLCAPCPYCEGAGYVKSVQTIVSEILQEAHKIAGAVEGKDVVLRVHPDVAKEVKASKSEYLQELEEILGRPVIVTADPLLHNEKFDLA